MTIQTSHPRSSCGSFCSARSPGNRGARSTWLLSPWQNQENHGKPKILLQDVWSCSIYFIILYLVWGYSLIGDICVGFVWEFRGNQKYTFHAMVLNQILWYFIILYPIQVAQARTFFIPPNNLSLASPTSNLPGRGLQAMEARWPDDKRSSGNSHFDPMRWKPTWFLGTEVHFRLIEGLHGQNMPYL